MAIVVIVSGVVRYAFIRTIRCPNCDVRFGLQNYGSLLYHHPWPSRRCWNCGADMIKAERANLERAKSNQTDPPSSSRTERSSGRSIEREQMNHFGTLPRLAVALVVAFAFASPALAAINATFKFVDHNMGAGDREFGLAAMDQDGKQVAVLESLDDQGKVAGVTFLTKDQWHKFLAAWREAETALANQSETYAPETWQYIDDAGTTASILLTPFASLSFDIRQAGAGVCIFDVAKDQMPEFDKALAKITEGFDGGHG
jgi:hypothetical protein